MPRPDSGFLSGVLAGISQFKQTRQFYEQMETTGLQQEAARAQMGFLEQQRADYESPAEQRAGRIESQLGAEASLATQVSERNLAVSEPSGRTGWIWRRNPNTQAWEEVKDDAFWLGKQIELAQAKTIPKTLSAEKALAEINEYATSQGIEIPGGVANVSAGVLNEAVKFAQAEMWGEALAIVRADGFARLPDLDWLADLPKDMQPLAADYLKTVAAQAPTTDAAIQSMNELRMQFENRGILPARINIDELLRGKYPVGEPASPQRLLLPKRELSGA